MRTKLGAALRLAFITLLLEVCRVSAATLYVSPVSPNPAPPYGGWATAATTIQDAVDAAVAGDEVVVSNGIYATGGRITAAGSTTNRVVLDKAVRVRSVNGPAVTVIQGYQTPLGSGPVRCVNLADGAVLTGFTLSGGVTGFSDRDGAGAYCASTNAVIMNCVITGNAAYGNGGGVSGGTLINCVLSGNSAQAGVGASGSILYNCTLTGNLGNVVVGGAVEFCTLYNCIVYDNTGSGGNYQVSTLNYCCTVPMPANGVGNITNAPLLVSPAAGDFRLQQGSPCIDAGINSYVGSDTDLGGNPRVSGRSVDMGAYEFQQTGPPVIAVQPFSQTVFAGTNVSFSVISASGALPIAWQWLHNLTPIPGATNSILTFPSISTNQAGGYSAVVTNAFGAVTSQVAVLTVLPGPLPALTLQPLSQIVSPGGNVTFTANAIGYRPLYWQWLFNGKSISGATDSSLTLASVTTNQAGTYSVIVTNAAGSTTSSDASLTVQQTATRYVWQNSANPAAPYSSWTTAAHAIQDAANTAQPGDEIVVTNGTYAGGLTLSQPLNLISVNGPQLTIIDGGGTNQCASIFSGASLSGFTLTNGMALAGGGASGGWPSGGFLTRCVLAGNRAYFAGGGGAYNCTLFNCTLTGNSAGTNGGGALYCTLYNCILTGNSSWSPDSQNLTVAAAYGCRLYNCLLTGNLGFGTYGSTLYNCTLTGNSVAGAVFSTLYNCIVYYNPTSGSPTNYFGNYYYSSTLNYCCTTPMPTNGVGNITNAPVFIDPANGDFHLQPTSPCINAGNNEYVPLTTDLDGNTRIVGGSVDIGAYEFQGTGSPAFYAWLQSYELPTDGSADYADPDGDGLNNWQEWVCGTNPTNALSVLRLLSAVPTSTNVTVMWQSVSGVNYFLERSLSFTPQAASGHTNFVVVATNILGQAGGTTYADTNAAGLGPFFYRVGVKAP